MTQMPPSLHTTVKCGSSNGFIEVTRTSGGLEPWSQPWHALQRNLASTFGAGFAAYRPGGVSPRSARPPAVSDANWLARAHRSVPTNLTPFASR